MNRALTEMLRSLNTPGNLTGNVTDMSMLEMQRAHIKWQQEHHHLQQLVEQQQQQLQYFDGNDQFGSVFAAIPARAAQFQGLIGGEDTGLHEVVNRAVKADPGLDNGWLAGEGSGMGSGGFGIGMNYEISRTTSCPPAVTAAVAMAETKQRESTSPEKMSSTVGRESFKKRKADKNRNLKAIAEEENSKEKRIKACAEEGESKVTDQNSNNDCKNTNNNNKRETSSADTSKVSEVQKPDYIHVRARRGQATDSHSLAERVRREKISERMKYLQDLVPGCNKITGKAAMLDEIINYVQSLQRQVEFLSMKLAAVNPTLDFNIDNFFSKEVFPACTSNFPVGLTSDITNHAYLQFNPMQQVVTYNGLEMGLNVPDVALRSTTSVPTSIPETVLDSYCFNHIQPSSAWDANLENLYGVELLQGRTTSFPTQQFTGMLEQTKSCQMSTFLSIPVSDNWIGKMAGK